MTTRGGRILLSIIIGAVLTELISASTDRKVEINALLFIIPLYFILTAIYKQSMSGRKEAKRPETKGDSEILDDDLI